jgi:hypothetical protein
VNCDVCSNPLEVECRIDDARGQGVRFACHWCLAAVTVMNGHAPVPFGYRPPSERWAAAIRLRAIAGPEVEHAVAPFSKTLCGLTVDSDLETLRKHFWPFHDGSCLSCSSAADLVDSRWPVGARGRPPREAP